MPTLSRTMKRHTKGQGGKIALPFGILFCEEGFCAVRVGEQGLRQSFQCCASRFGGVGLRTIAESFAEPGFAFIDSYIDNRTQLRGQQITEGEAVIAVGGTVDPCLRRTVMLSEVDKHMKYFVSYDTHRKQPHRLYAPFHRNMS